MSAPSGPVLVVSGEALTDSPAGPALRVRGLAAALARRGLAVVVAAPPSSTAPDGCALAALDDLPRLVRSARCIVASGFLLEEHPALAGAAPLCVDLAGPFVVENLWVHRDRPAGERRRVLDDEAGVLRRLLRAADLVLCAHARQRDALLGALLATGSLRPELLDGDPALTGLLAELPFGVPDAEPPARPPAVTGPLRLVWPGGLWAWLDPVTAVEGVGRARAAGAEVTLELWGARSPDPRVPPMAAAQEATARAAALGVAEAVELVGWVPYGERLDRLAHADVAVTLDGGGVEARLAFRTRLLDALWAGVPTLATRGEWVADAAGAAGAGWTVPPGDAGAVADVLVRLAGAPAEREDASRRGREFAGAYRYDRLVEPLAAWCAAPLRRRAGDPPLRQRLASEALRRTRAARARIGGRGGSP